MNRATLIRKMLTVTWLIHIGIDSLLILGYYIYIHPPSATTPLINMAVELPVVLGVADIITHYTLAYD